VVVVVGYTLWTVKTHSGALLRLLHLQELDAAAHQLHVVKEVVISWACPKLPARSAERERNKRTCVSSAHKSAKHTAFN
jgi:hypothetical protein